MQTEMVVNSSEARRRDLARIHIAKKQLGLSEDDYRAVLRKVAGVKSAAGLTEHGRKIMISHLKTMGFRSVHKSARASGMHRPAAPERALLLSKIGATLADLRLPWRYADGIAKKMYGVERVRWLYPNQLQKVMVALIYHQKRRRREVKTIPADNNAELKKEV